MKAGTPLRRKLNLIRALLRSAIKIVKLPRQSEKPKKARNNKQIAKSKERKTKEFLRPR